VPSNENNTLLKRPQNRSAKIWRYMNVEKYLYLLNYSRLFFVRSDKLDDAFEGSWTKLDIENRKKHSMSLPNSVKDKSDEDFSKILMNMKKKTFISCWNAQDAESLSLWKIYGEVGKSIAIQSTYERLHNSVTEQVTLGLVEYIDYEIGSFFSDERRAASPFYFKRMEFANECELRGTIQYHKFGVIDPNEEFYDNNFGVDHPVDLENLVEEVVVSPETPEWLLELLSSVTKKFGYSFPLVRSRLDAQPQF